MKSVPTKLDFLAKELFKAIDKKDIALENYYLTMIDIERKSDIRQALGELNVKASRTGQYSKEKEQEAKNNINNFYCIILKTHEEMKLQQKGMSCFDAFTQTENILEIEKVSEIQLLGNKEGINEEVFEDNF